jgi:CheY-like chemotaxis protein
MNAMTPAEILIVEDNPCDADLTIRALRMNGITCSIVCARDGAEALDLLLGLGPRPDLCLRPKLIVLDLKLPKVDGFELLERIKTNPASRTLPVVVLSSSAEETDVQRCYRLGVNSYIVKPVEFDRFNSAVGLMGRYWLHLNQPESPSSGASLEHQPAPSPPPNP